MSEFPMWFPIAGLVYGFVALAVMWIWSRRLDHADQEARRRRQIPAE